MEFTHFLLVSFLLLVGLYLLVPPLLIYKTFAQEIEPTLLPEGEDSLPSRDVYKKFFQTTEAQLGKLGFEYIDRFYMPSAATNAKALLVRFVNRDTKDSAMTTAMFAPINNAWVLHVNYIEFSTCFTDGSLLRTLNSKYIGSFPEYEGKLVTYAPWIHDTTELYEAHQSITQAKQGTRTKVLNLFEKFDGDASAWLLAGICEENQVAEQHGYLRKSPDGRFQHATLKGAYLMTWCLLPPFKGMRFRSKIAEARKRLAVARGM